MLILFTLLLFSLAKAQSYMDVHAKYSHSKFIPGIGRVVRSEKVENGYNYYYDSGWLEEIRFVKCTKCDGGSILCRVCGGQGYNYGVPCMACGTTGRVNCNWCNGRVNQVQVGAVNREQHLVYLCDLTTGGKGRVYSNNSPSNQPNNNHYTPNTNSSNNEKCPSCNGTGKCYNCAGRGERYSAKLGYTTDCVICNGGGQCPRCGGKGHF